MSALVFSSLVEPAEVDGHHARVLEGLLALRPSPAAGRAARKIHQGIATSGPDSPTTIELAPAEQVEMLFAIDVVNPHRTDDSLNRLQHALKTTLDQTV